MNCAPSRSPSKSMVPPIAGSTASRFGSRTEIIFILVAAFLLLISNAYASPGTLVANGLNQPRGAVRVSGVVWAADIANGFCRIDAGVLNLATCFTPGNAQPELDISPVDGVTPLVYVAGTTGVFRLAMSADGSTIVSSATLAPNAGLAGNLPQSAVIGADGKLYVSFTSTGDIKRITNPSGSPAAQTVESVGKAASGGGPVNSLSFINGDLYVADTGLIGLERIANAAACTGGCKAVSMFGVLGISNSLSSDRVRYLYMENGTRVLRYDGSTTNAVVIYSQSATQAGVTFGYGTIWGVSYDAATGDVFVGGDPTPPGGATSNIGSLYNVVAPNTTEGTVVTQFGPPAPVPSPTPVPGAAKTGSLFAPGITNPHGMLWINTHAWVSDAASGFCRIDPSGPGIAALSNCFKPSATFVAGQASFDPATSNIYVPDAATASSGIYRISFVGVTETLGVAVNLGQGGLQPTALAVGPDGSLYFGTRTSGNINKITTPSTVPSAPVRIATTSNGLGVRAMLFIANDLYLAETVNVTVIIRASPSLLKGKAVIVGPSIAKGTPPVLNVANPLSISADLSVAGFPQLFIGSDPGGLGTLGQVDKWDIMLQTDTLWADTGIIGAVPTAFSNPAGLANAPGGLLYVADDPTVTSAGTTPTPGQGHLYQVGP
jgi:hypothetical protein